MDAPFFASPVGQALRLPVAPRLASWNTATDPDQVRLASYLAAAETLLHPTLDGMAGPFALRLDVGLPAAVDLVGEHDLDNYAYPLVTRLARTVTAPFAAVWCGKQHAACSHVTVSTAAPAPVPTADQSFDVTTSASTSTTAYKQQIVEQLETATVLPPGPVVLHLSFVVGPGRNWVNLWKPTIDSLDRLLGRTREGRLWHPLDGRITELGLHHRVDVNLGHDVRLTIAASSVSHPDDLAVSP